MTCVIATLAFTDFDFLTGCFIVSHDSLLELLFTILFHLLFFQLLFVFPIHITDIFFFHLLGRLFHCWPSSSFCCLACNLSLTQDTTWLTATATSLTKAS